MLDASYSSHKLSMIDDLKGLLQHQIQFFSNSLAFVIFFFVLDLSMHGRLFN